MQRNQDILSVLTFYKSQLAAEIDVRVGSVDGPDFSYFGCARC